MARIRIARSLRRGQSNPATALSCRSTREAEKFLSTLATQEASLPETQLRGAMDEDHRELLRRLFVAVAEMTETAHEAAIDGQSQALIQP